MAATLRDIASEHGAEVLPRLSVLQARALEHIATCQTPAQGYHRYRCDVCSHSRLAYNSCRKRYCSRCLRAQSGKWFEARERELLPVPYFHVVFTLPSELRPLARQNPKLLYTLLFRASADTLLEVAENPKRLGATLGFFSVLHTWGRDLRYHPHVHCVVPGGGLARDPEDPGGHRWVQVPRPSYFLPVQVLALVFRAKFLEGLRRLYEDDELALAGKLASLAHPPSFENLLRRLSSKGWIVYAEPPFAGPKAVLAYLARYTHRTAISDERILSHEDGEVAFRYKDYADGQKTKVRVLPAEDFLVRFAAHILPRGFVRIRYFGLLANRHRRAKVALCRSLLRESLGEGGESEPLDRPDPYVSDGPRCRTCGAHLDLVEVRWTPGPEVRPFGPLWRRSRGPP